MSDPNQQWQPPPPPPLAEPPDAGGPVMSTPETLTGIFFEPGRVFESFRSRPKFLVAGLIMLLLTVGVTVLIYQRMDMGEYIREKIVNNPRNANQTEEQKEMAVKIGKFVGYLIPVFVPIMIAAGAALYLLGVMAFGGSISYKKALAVWVYSSFPPAVLGTIVAVLVLLLKPADQIDPERMMVTNPAAFMGSDASPVVVSLLGNFDLLGIYGLVLAAIGLRKVAKISSGSAWAIVLGFFLIRAILGVSSAAIFGG